MTITILVLNSWVTLHVCFFYSRVISLGGIQNDNFLLRGSIFHSRVIFLGSMQNDNFLLQGSIFHSRVIFLGSIQNNNVLLQGSILHFRVIFLGSIPCDCPSPITSSRALNFSSMASLSSFSIPSSFLISLSCSLRIKSRCCFRTFSST